MSNGRGKRPGQDDHADSLDRIADAIEHYVHHCLHEGGATENQFAEIARKLDDIFSIVNRDKITLHFTINEQENAMQTLDPQHGFTDRKLPFEAFVGMAGAPDEAGNPTVVPDPSKPLVVESSDETQAGIVQVDATHWEVTTPLAEGGAATITIKAAQGAPGRIEPVQFAFDYVVPTVDRINVAFGGLVPDEP